MRQGQQNRRGRGRNNNSNNNNSYNNRKNQNPLTRSFESAGPDIKIRGTPSHVAEKYVALARDALSSGDRVLAENYLQHAEHYNRIILTFREQQMSQGGDAAQGGQGRTHGLHSNDGTDDDNGDDDSSDVNGNAMSVMDGGQGHAQPSGQPSRGYDSGGQRSDNRQDNRQPRHSNQNNRSDRGDRGHNPNQSHNNGNGGDQQGFRRRESFQPSARDAGGPDRPNQDRHPGNRPQPDRASVDVASGSMQPPGAPQPSIAADVDQEQPAFLRRPVRRPRRDAAPTGAGSDDTPAKTSADDKD